MGLLTGYLKDWAKEAIRAGPTSKAGLQEVNPTHWASNVLKKIWSGHVWSALQGRSISTQPLLAEPAMQLPAPTAASEDFGHKDAAWQPGIGAGGMASTTSPKRNAGVLFVHYPVERPSLSLSIS